jgi:hypothetical protein
LLQWKATYMYNPNPHLASPKTQEALAV